MKSKAFGILVVAAVASLLSSSAFAETAKKPGAAKPSAGGKSKTDLVKCFSQSCAGIFEYKGEKNSCDSKAFAMAVPKEICDPKKGLKIVEE